jgi:hypothetical protein
MVTNDPPTNTPNENATWYKWIFGQPAYIVMLVCLLSAIAYGTWYGLPAALSQIQHGYETIDMRHAAERKEMREDSKADRVEFRTAIENNTKALEKLSEQIKN